MLITTKLRPSSHLGRVTFTVLEFSPYQTLYASRASSVSCEHIPHLLSFNSFSHGCLIPFLLQKHGRFYNLDRHLSNQKTSFRV